MPTLHDKELDHLLDEWERWAAELLESHISFPVVGYFRSHALSRHLRIPLPPWTPPREARHNWQWGTARDIDHVF